MVRYIAWDMTCRLKVLSVASDGEYESQRHRNGWSVSGCQILLTDLLTDSLNPFSFILSHLVSLRCLNNYSCSCTCAQIQLCTCRLAYLPQALDARCTLVTAKELRNKSVCKEKWQPLTYFYPQAGKKTTTAWGVGKYPNERLPENKGSFGDIVSEITLV